MNNLDEHFNDVELEDPNEQEELWPLEHVSLDAHRLKYDRANLERAFAEQWQYDNNPNCSRNFGYGTLQDLMVRQNDGNKVYYWITQREATIVATVIQWLGTNCGYGFLQQVLDSCGLCVVPSTRSYRNRFKEEFTTKQRQLILFEE